MVTLDGLHRRKALCNSKVEGACTWTEEDLCLQRTIRRDGVKIKQVDAIKMSKMSNTTAAIIRMDRSSVDIRKDIISYVCAFQLQYGVKFMQARIKRIVDDMMPSNQLPTHSRLSSLQYVWLPRFCLEKVNSYYSGEVEGRR